MCVCGAERALALLWQSKIKHQQLGRGQCSTCSYAVQAGAELGMPRVGLQLQGSDGTLCCLLVNKEYSRMQRAKWLRSCCKCHLLRSSFPPPLLSLSFCSLLFCWQRTLRTIEIETYYVDDARTSCHKNKVQRAAGVSSVRCHQLRVGLRQGKVARGELTAQGACRNAICSAGIIFRNVHETNCSPAANGKLQQLL